MEDDIHDLMQDLISWHSKRSLADLSPPPRRAFKKLPNRIPDMSVKARYPTFTTCIQIHSTSLWRERKSLRGFTHWPREVRRSSKPTSYLAIVFFSVPQISLAEEVKDDNTIAFLLPRAYFLWDPPTTSILSIAGACTLLQHFIVSSCCSLQYICFSLGK